MKSFIILSLVTTAFAQSVSSTATASGTPAQVTVQPNGAIVAGSVVSVLGGMQSGVAGAPFSAEQVSETVQTLADGTRITQPSTKVMYYRDSQGRTRVERTFPSPPGVPTPANQGPGMIEITDPVGGVRYMLQPGSHKATKMSLPPQFRPSSANTAVPAANPTSPQARPATPTANRPESKNESLGSEMIEGVLANGSRTTTVFPIGSFGNDRPVTTIFETWMSPDLKMVMLSKRSDPRTGETTTRLTDLSRTEPDPALFQVPTDYEIVEPQVRAAGQ